MLPDALLVTFAKELPRHVWVTRQDWLREIVAGYRKWLRDEEAAASDRGESLCRYLIHRAEACLAKYLKLQEQRELFSREITAAQNASEIKLVVLYHAQMLEPTAKDLRRDRRAWTRWFTPDVLLERFQRREGITQRDLSSYLELLGIAADACLQSCASQQRGLEIWARLEPEEFLQDLFTFDGDPRVRRAALAALRRAIQSTPTEEMLRGSTVQFIYSMAQQRGQDPQLQCEALSILGAIAPEAATTVIQKRLAEPGTGDDFFVRRHALLVLLKIDLKETAREAILAAAMNDPSPYFRQTLAEVLAKTPTPENYQRLETLALQDQDEPVRMAALLAGRHLLGRDSAQQERYRDLLLKCLKQENSPTVLRTVCHAIEQFTPSLKNREGDDFSAWCATLMNALLTLRRRTESVPVQRWAGRAHEFLWSEATPERRQIKEELANFLRQTKRGARRRLPAHLRPAKNPELFGRLLAVLVQDDFGCDIECGWLSDHLTRGHKFGLRLWRILHEVRHPRPEKRQAFNHCLGRLFSGQIRVPAGGLAELTQTTVPGEPLYLPEEAGWRPYLPLVDDAISSLALGVRQSVRFYTSEGVTVLTTPGRLRGLLAYWRLTWSFVSFADLRNWQNDSDLAPSAYIQALRNLGFQISFESYSSNQETAESQGTHDNQAAKPTEAGQFFGLAAMPFFPDLPWQSFWDHFVSIYENNLLHLSVFTAGITLLFLGLHWFRNARFRRARKSIPLVIGGWGTRGKSGTERLKSAIFSTLGYSYVCKTSGCEAMFLHADPYGETREFFFFRPYDRATIWEQADLVDLAAQAKVDVFLWECMALTPEYVKILQHAWMHDTLSTITNTYPDHEDLQGPAGINLPDVMAEFIPKQSTLLTSEEQMRPILQAAATERGTELKGVGWLEAGLLTKDILERFPYDEHPHNIALVKAMCDELGIEESFALKSMADAVLPDLGVLKTHPAAVVHGRSLSFTNGMSANERLGCLGNWTRSGFDQHDPRAEPTTWLLTVVNNRADRIPRSRIFAQILVHDIRADCHLLIGNNLKGLRSYIEQEWQTWLGAFSLWARADSPNLEAQRRWTQALVYLRLPHSENQVQARLAGMLKGGQTTTDATDSATIRAELEPDWAPEILQDLLTQYEQDCRDLEIYQDFLVRIEQTKEAERRALESAVKEQLTSWFWARFVIIEDYHATGDEVIEALSRATPPGFQARIMGLQNIKGTGLDFVYRWQDWDQCHSACEDLVSRNKKKASHALDTLLAFPRYGLLCRQLLQDSLAQLLASAIGQESTVQARAKIIRDRLAAAAKTATDQADSTAAKHARLGILKGYIFSLVEQGIDGIDAILRRRRADRIYRDFLDERISRERAVQELRALTLRQKGGWLGKLFG